MHHEQQRVENFTSYMDSSGRKRANQSVAAMVNGRPEGSVATQSETEGLQGRSMTEDEARTILGRHLVVDLFKRKNMAPIEDPVLEPQLKVLCEEGAIDCTPGKRGAKKGRKTQKRARARARA